MDRPLDPCPDLDARIDLHAHTEHSDGTLTPTALVRLAAEAGLSLLAVTDHDTTAGLEEARAAGKALGVEILAGCEISTQIDGDTVHILAYDFRVEDPGLQAFLAEVRRGRDDRNDRLFDRLADLGVPVGRDEVLRHVQGRIMARPHFARAMVDRGHVPDVRTAFHKYLGDDAVAYVEPDTPIPEEAIRAAVAASAVTVLAHPRQLRLPTAEAYRELFRRFAAAGLTGIEVDHPSHAAEERAMFRGLADDLGLVASGGSDFHGTNKPHIAIGVGDGSIDVRRATWERLRARATERRR